jgi:hypothetical protein
MIEIEPSDAWIFLSIARSGGAELADFYAAADHLNVALPSDSELEGGVRRLVSCNLVAVDGQRFRLTPEGQALLVEVGGLGAAPRPQVEPCQRLLEIRARDAVLTCDWSPDPSEASRARSAYHKDMRALIAPPRRKS